MKERDWTRVLGWPGYRVYQIEIDEPGKKLRLCVREISEREVRDLELLPDQGSLRRGRGYKNVRYLLLKAKRMAIINAQLRATKASYEARRLVYIEMSMTDATTKLKVDGAPATI